MDGRVACGGFSLVAGSSCLSPMGKGSWFCCPGVTSLLTANTSLGSDNHRYVVNTSDKGRFGDTGEKKENEEKTQ